MGLDASSAEGQLAFIRPTLLSLDRSEQIRIGLKETVSALGHLAQGQNHRASFSIG